MVRNERGRAEAEMEVGAGRQRKISTSRGEKCTCKEKSVWEREGAKARRAARKGMGRSSEGVRTQTATCQ